MQELIQIVPNLPPRIDGIGDYALQLARRLRDEHQGKISFLVCDPDWRGESAVDGFPARSVSRRSAPAFEQAVREAELGEGDAAPILLHFSPYGYQKRGCPYWLVAGLEALERASPGRVNTAFHELNISSKRIWSSTFWVPGMQKHLLTRLAKIGGFHYTNTGEHQVKLERWSNRKIPLILNFATLGERDVEPPFSSRRREIIIFGRADQRRWTYERGAKALIQLRRHLDAERIHDVGAPIPGHDCVSIDGCPVVRHGIMDSPQLSELMSSTLASFMYYPIPLLTKSSVHALTCASGALSFVYDDAPVLRSCKGLITDVDFIPVRPSLPLPGPEMWESICSNVYANYQSHSSHATAQLVSGLLRTQLPTSLPTSAGGCQASFCQSI